MGVLGERSLEILEIELEETQIPGHEMRMATYISLFDAYIFLDRD